MRVFGENLFIANYIRSETTAGGIIRPFDNVKEDEFQGNVGIILKLGDGFENGAEEELLHKWVVFGYNDGLRENYNDVSCRVISIDRVRQMVPDPSKVL